MELSITPGQGVIPRATLNDLYVTWCRNEGIRQESAKALANELQSRGVEGGKTNVGRTWKGIWRES